MGRRLAEATKAWRARRTRGETVLRRFRGLPLFVVVLAWLFPADFVDDFAVGVFAEDLAGGPLTAGLAGVADDSGAGGDEDDVDADGALCELDAGAEA
jgi:hypothetical protein